MKTDQEQLSEYTDVLFDHFYVSDVGAFSLDVEPQSADVFPTIEALYSLLHSPAKAKFEDQIRDAIEFLVEKLEENDGKTPTYSAAEESIGDYSTLSISFSLIVLARGRKFIRNNARSPELQSRINDLIRSQYEVLIEAKREGGWSYVPAEGVRDWDYDFEPDVYCTAIALQALINCTETDFPEDTISSHRGHQTLIVTATRELLELAEVPQREGITESGELQQPPDQRLFKEAVLMAHWMHVLSHVLYDTDGWDDTTKEPEEVPEIKTQLRRSSELLSELIQKSDVYPDETEFGFADIVYELTLEYPKRESGNVTKGSFSFELPGSTALPALVLNPDVSLWSEATRAIYQQVTEQFTARQEDLRNYGITGGDTEPWQIYSLSAPLLGISYMQSVNEGTRSFIRYFLQEGEVPSLQSSTRADPETGLDGRNPPGSSDPREQNHHQTDSGRDLDAGEPDLARDSRLVRTALRIDRYFRRLRLLRSKVALYQVVLLGILIAGFCWYTIGVLQGAPVAQIHAAALVSGILSAVVVYDLQMIRTCDRWSSTLYGVGFLVGVSTTAAAFTPLPDELLALAAVLVPAIYQLGDN